MSNRTRMAKDTSDQLFAKALAAEKNGRLADAKILYQQLLQSDPKHYGGLVNLANNYARTGESTLAAALYTRATKAHPGSKEALVNFANLYMYSGQLSKARKLYERVLAKEPSNAPALNNLGNVLKNAGDIHAASDAYRRSADADPNFTIAQHNFLFSLNYDPQLTNDHIALAHRNWGKKWRAPGDNKFRTHQCNGKLKIGYVSPDFRSHSVATFFEPVLTKHDRRKFHVTCYSNVADKDQTTDRIQGLADSWHDIHHLDDDDAATVIQGDEIDILVDLAGHTSRNRLLLFARKLAPLQVTALGYPNTSGLNTVDCRLSEGDPPGVDQFYTERLHRLPRGLHCFDRPPEAPPVGRL
ncbi:MAG: tetratricopeptide repeat protein, partial [Gammaproteobacteria bacterium]